MKVVTTTAGHEIGAAAGKIKTAWLLIMIHGALPFIYVVSVIRMSASGLGRPGTSI